MIETQRSSLCGGGIRGAHAYSSGANCDTWRRINEVRHRLRPRSFGTLMCEKWDSIRDVIAFPKTQRGQGLMVDATSAVTEKQLRELHIKLRNV